AADFRLGRIGELRRVGINLGQLDARAAFGKTRSTTLTLADNVIGRRRVEIFERHIAIECRRDGPDLEGHFGGEVRRRTLLELLAAGNGPLEYFGIVQRVPDDFARSVDRVLAGDVHGLLSLLSLVSG